MPGCADSFLQELLQKTETSQLTDLQGLDNTRVELSRIDDSKLLLGNPEKSEMLPVQMKMAPNKVSNNYMLSSDPSMVRV